MAFPINENNVKIAITQKKETIESRQTIFSYLHYLEMGVLSHSLFLPVIQTEYYSLLKSVTSKKLHGITKKIVGTRHLHIDDDTGEVSIELHSILRGGKVISKSAFKEIVIKNVNQALLYFKGMSENERADREVVYVENIFKLLVPLNLQEELRESIWKLLSDIAKAERNLYFKVAKVLRLEKANTLYNVEQVIANPKQCVNNPLNVDPLEFSNYVLKHCNDEVNALMEVSGLTHLTSLRNRYNHILQLSAKFRKFQKYRNEYVARHLGLIYRQVQCVVKPNDHRYSQFCHDAALKLSVNMMRFDPNYAYATFAVPTVKAEIAERMRKDSLVNYPDNVYTDQKTLLVAAVHKNEDGQEYFNNENALETIKLIDKTDKPSQYRIAELRYAGSTSQFASIDSNDDDESNSSSYLVEAELSSNDMSDDFLEDRAVIRKLTSLVKRLPPSKAKKVIYSFGLESVIDESQLGASRPIQSNDADYSHYKMLYQYASELENEKD